MTYSVIWSGGAVRDLGRIASRLSDPAEADREAVGMDMMLRRRPNAMGESRYGNHRLWYGSVIAIWFTVDDATKTVRILTVGPARRR